MGFPGLNIQFINGQLGQVKDIPDGVFGLMASAVAVAGKFALNTPYQIRGMVDVAALGIIPDVNNYKLYKTLSEFYKEAGEGTQLWIMGIAKTVKVSDWFKPNAGTGRATVETLLDAANGDIKAIFTAFSPTGAYTVEVEDGLDQDVWTSLSEANSIAEDYTSRKYAPFFVILEGYAFSGDKVALADLTEMNYNRCTVLLGDSEKRTGPTASKGAAIGVLAGRLAKVQVHVNPGKVADGSLSNLKAYILDTAVEQYDTEALHDKGYTTFRTHAHKAGYYFSDAPMATEATDDYNDVPSRRTIDKAFVVVYSVLIESLLADLDVKNDGTISPIFAKTIEGAVGSAIYTQMTTNNELSFDPTDPKDLGVIVEVDLSHNVTSTSKIKFSSLQVRRKATGRFMDVPLGYIPVNSNS